MSGAEADGTEWAADCGCYERRDYDGERITTHCAPHCPRIQAGQSEPGPNGLCNGC